MVKVKTFTCPIKIFQTTKELGDLDTVVNQFILISKMKVAPEQERAPGIQEDLVIPISEDELMQKIRQSLS